MRRLGESAKLWQATREREREREPLLAIQKAFETFGLVREDERSPNRSIVETLSDQSSRPQSRRVCGMTANSVDESMQVGRHRVEFNETWRCSQYIGYIGYKKRNHHQLMHTHTNWRNRPHLHSPSAKYAMCARCAKCFS